MPVEQNDDEEDSDNQYYPQTFDRSQFYVRLLVDDQEVPLSDAISDCKDKSTCSYDLVHNYISNRLVNNLEELCFTHLNYEELNSEDIPWWLAISIVVPLVAISLYGIKIALNKYNLPAP